MDTNDLYEIIDDLLENYGAEDAENCVFCASSLDGFFTAIGCAPEMIPPSEWMPAIWGGEEHSPMWETTKEAQDFTSAAMEMCNRVMQTLITGEIAALFTEYKVESTSYTIVDDWCAGFLIGANLWGPLPPQMLIPIEDHLQPMRMFATSDGIEQLDDMSDGEVDFWKDQIEPAVLRIFKTLRSDNEHFTQPQPTQQSLRVSRNDPCPCGSGKKYKKCCLH